MKTQLQFAEQKLIAKNDEYRLVNEKYLLLLSDQVSRDKASRSVEVQVNLLPDSKHQHHLRNGSQMTEDKSDRLDPNALNR